MVKSANTRPQRISKELQEIINYIKGRSLLHGTKPPSTSQITRIIAKNTDKEDLWRNVFIKI